MVQGIKLPLVRSTIQFGKLVQIPTAALKIQLPATVLGEAVKLTTVFWLLPLTWKTQDGIPGF